jgi:hypothetical protein
MESLKDLCLSALRKKVRKSETILKDLNNGKLSNDAVRDLISDKNDHSYH